MNRRELIQWGLGALGISMLSGVAQAAEKRGARPAEGATETYVDPAKEPMAKSVNFATKKADVKKADIKVEKQGVKFDEQHCSNCMLYATVGLKDGKESGKCTLFAGKLVHGESWCTSWAKKS